jgi:hypothetical protein
MRHEQCFGQWEAPPETVSDGLPVPEEQFIKNVRDNCLLDLPNLETAKEHDKIMVMVCGGPTAKQHIEEIRQKRNDDRYRIFSSNITHDWLISQGVIPHYQFIIDPKASKIDDVQNPHEDVEYLISVTCDPGVFKALEGYKVTRVFSITGVGDPPDHQVIKALFPYQPITYLGGGSMAGLRAMSLADVMGYLTVEFYGFDSCYFDTDEKGMPIYYSYDKPRAENVIECQTEDGRVFLSSPVFASQARQFIIWKHRYEWIKFVVHGDSLTKAINDIDDEKCRPKHDLLITDYHRQVNKELLLRKPRKAFGENDPKATFGVSGKQHAGTVSVMAGKMIKDFGAPVTVLDYGCGQRTLEAEMPPIAGMEFKNYDPCVDGIDAPPEPADLVVCTDVLEHIEPDCLENVLNDLKRVTKKVAFVSIATEKACKSYSDGQNTHKIVQRFDWWLPKLKKRFYVLEAQQSKNNFNCVLQVRP